MKRRKWMVVIGILIVVGFVLLQILPGLMFVSAIPDPHSVPLNKEVANELVKDLEEFGKIYRLDDCRRHSKSINGVAIRMKAEQDDNEYGKYFKEVLQEQGISESDFERFRKELEESKLRCYIRTDKYSVFIVDGFLDNVWGYLFTHTNGIENGYLQVDIYTVRAIEDLGENWYRIAGS